MADPSSPAMPGPTGTPVSEGAPAAAPGPNPPPAAPAIDPAQLHAQLEQTRAELQQTRQHQDAMQRYLVGFVAQQNAPAPPDPKEMDAQFRDLMDRDPRRAMEIAAEERMRPIVEELQATTLQAQAQQEKAAAYDRFDRSDDPQERREWQTLKPKVEAFLANLPLDVLAKPGVVNAAYDQVWALNRKDLLAARNTAVLTAERQAAMEPGSGAPSLANRDAALSRDEKRMAEEFGMTEEQWRANRVAAFVETRGGL